MRLLLLFLFLFLFDGLATQPLYFPPIDDEDWEWTDQSCAASELAELQSFLDEKNTKAFIMLKGGKILTEMYFDQFTQDSIWYWASAGKSLVATLIGIAQQEGMLNIEDATSDHLGSGWTICEMEEENQIRIRHQISMTTGLDNSLGFECTEPACLDCLTVPGTRWFYHNGPYTLTQSVIQSATGLSATQYYNQKIGDPIGAAGSFIPLGYNRIFFSKPRAMARFGLLILAQGNWNGTQIYAQDTYFEQMTQSSQSINPSYGYLWWLNGMESHVLPGTTFSFNGPIVSTAPDEMFAAMGKNEQRLYIVPSQELVVVRLGEAAGGPVLALSQFDEDLWERLSVLSCLTTGVEAIAGEPSIRVFPNPSAGNLRAQSMNAPISEVRLFNLQGQAVNVHLDKADFSVDLDLSTYASGVYFLQILATTGRMYREKLLLH